MRTRILAGALAALLAFPGATLAQDAPLVSKPDLSDAERLTMPTLWPGDPAPPLTVEKWVKGEKVPAFSPGHVYIVEFWAVWCVPCIKNMPHLTELQKKYAGKITVIGMTTGDSENTIERVEAMVKTKGDAIGYTIGFDRGATYGAYMKAARQSGIPWSFVVDGTGKIAFLGHPSQLDEVLEHALDGSLDVAGFRENMRDYHERRIASLKAFTRYDQAVKAQDWGAVIEACDALEATHLPDYAWATPEKFEVMLIRLKQYDKAYAAARALAAGVARDDAGTLARLSWTITAFDGVETRDLGLAMELAQHAYEIDKGANPFILRALGAAYFAAGDKATAIQLGEKAVEGAKYDWDKELLEKALKWFKGESGRPGKG